MSGPFCVNCTHHRKAYDGYDAYAECIRPISPRRNLVTGELDHRVWQSCNYERRFGRTVFTLRDRCGPRGQFFQARGEQS